MKQKQLRRSNTDKILFGIIGGLSEYFDISSVLARIIFILLLIVTGFFPFVFLYIAAIFVIPKDVEKVVFDIKRPE
jgi:phage shock protein C